MKQITAVDWLGAAIQLHLNFSNGKLTDESFNGLFKRAKEMEKEQIIKHSVELAKILISNPYETSGKMPTELIDSYINETFKSE
jgi:hypothetical protein